MSKYYGTRKDWTGLEILWVDRTANYGTIA